MKSPSDPCSSSCPQSKLMFLFYSSIHICKYTCVLSLHLWSKWYYMLHTILHLQSPELSNMERSGFLPTLSYSYRIHDIMINIFLGKQFLLGSRHEKWSPIEFSCVWDVR